MNNVEEQKEETVVSGPIAEVEKQIDSQGDGNTSSMVEDLEKRYAAQEALVREREKEVEERTRALLDALYDAKKYLLILEQADLIVILLDGASRKFVYLNKRCEDLFGFERNEVLRSRTPEIFQFVALESHRDLFGDEFEESMESGKSFRNSFAYTAKDGHEGVVRLTVSKFVDEGGGVLYVFLGEDITSERERERIERKRTEETERLNQLMIGRELRMIALKEEIRHLRLTIATLKGGEEI
jgi:PAS domain S-box-containing protein